MKRGGRIRDRPYAVGVAVTVTVAESLIGRTRM
jgi:hypothetical protein